MAKKSHTHKDNRVYRLYLWNHHDLSDAATRRGKCIGEFSHYKDLVAEAKRRAVAAGYPKSRWSILFDWNV